MQSRHLMARQVANFLSQRWYVNVLQSLSHWLHNPTSSSFLKLSSPPNMALTSPSVSKLSFKICSLFTASTIGLSGDSQAKCFFVLLHLLSLRCSRASVSITSKRLLRGGQLPHQAALWQTVGAKVVYIVQNVIMYHCALVVQTWLEDLSPVLDLQQCPPYFYCCSHTVCHSKTCPSLWGC